MLVALAVPSRARSRPCFIDFIHDSESEDVRFGLHGHGAGIWDEVKDGGVQELGLLC